MLLALSQDDDLGIPPGHDHVAADGEVITQINEPASGPEPGRASSELIRMPCPHPRGHLQTVGVHQELSHVVNHAIGEVPRTVPTAGVGVVILAQMHAHAQFRQSAICPERLQHEVGQVLPDPVRVSDAPPVSLCFVPDRILLEEGIDQLFDIRMFRPVVTREAPAGMLVRIWLLTVLLCLRHIRHLHWPSLDIRKNLSDKSSETGLI